MHDAAQVRVAQRVGDVAQHAHDVARRDAAVADTVGERFAVHQRHDEKDVPVELVGAMDRHDARMRQAAGGASFAKEPFADLRIAGEMRRQRLDRDGPIELHISRGVDHAHASAPDFALELILAGERGGEAKEVVGLRVRRSESHDVYIIQ